MAETRRLAAIMFTDMVGYSALAQRDESLALRLLDEHRGLLRTIFGAYAGREVKTIGDAFLVEFPSALQAMECAVAIQRELRERNEQSGGGHIELRIGIHLGDVIERAGDLLGDAVNIASRIEPLAETSGICISGPVFDQVRNKVPYSCTQLEHAFLKNIDTPMSVYSLDLPWVVPPAARLTPWTDRESELGTIERIIEAAARGQGNVVAFTGESGIGKTRLADEGIRKAEGKGFRTLRGRGHQDEQPIPYSLWVQVARGVLRDIPAPLLYKLSAGCAASLVKLVPEVGERLGQLPSAGENIPDAARLQFFEGIAQFLINLSRESPLLVLLDDLQWADPGSLRLLDYLAEPIRSQSVLLFLTFRDSLEDETPLLKTVIQDLTHSRAVVRIPVRRMEGGPARQLVGAILGTKDPPPELVGLVRQKTGGNPLFVEELLRSLTEERQLVRRGENWDSSAIADVGVPSTMRDVILKRAARAGEQAKDVLSVAAVLGMEFDFELLQRVSGVDPDRLLAQVEGLLRARLLREREIAPGRSVYTFADDQTREVLYRELSLVRRQRYHLKTAQALEGRFARGGDAVAGELSLHYHRGNDLSSALKWTLLAGENSASSYAREQAVMYYRTALEILKEAPNERTRAEVLERLGTELEILGQYEESVRRRTEASEVYERLGDRLRAGAALHQAASHSGWTLLGEFPFAEAPLTKAKELLESVPPSPELARLYLDYAAYLGGAGRTKEARALWSRSLELADSVGAPVVKAAICLELAKTAPSGARDEVRRNIDLALEIGLEHDPPTALEAYFHGAWYAATGLGDMDGCQEWIRRAVEYARKVKAPNFEVAIQGSLGSFARIWVSDLDESLRLAVEHQKSIRALNQAQTAHNLYHLIAVPLLRGELDGLPDLLHQAEEILSKEMALYQEIWFSFISGLIGLVSGDPSGGEKQLLRGMKALRKRGEVEFDGFIPIWLQTLLFDAAISQQALQRAEDYLAGLAGSVERVGGAPALAYLARARGLLALHTGREPEAFERLLESTQLWRKAGWKIELARTCVDLAGVEIKRGSLDRATSLLDEAIGQFRSQGADRAVHQLLELRQSLGTSPISS
ncbi:MAG TPA: AAA family ATPase [Thermoplasmata archaeon]|nr:AAA family ATPase [Thermoplasmata archaeon]